MSGRQATALTGGIIGLMLALCFGGWWAFVRPVHLIADFCASVEVGESLDDVRARASLAGHESFDRSGRWYATRRAGMSRAACAVEHVAGRVTSTRASGPD